MRRIVLIQDDADLYSLIRSSLERESFAVIGSASGQKALQLCEREKPT